MHICEGREPGNEAMYIHVVYTRAQGREVYRS